MHLSWGLVPFLQLGAWLWLCVCDCVSDCVWVSVCVAVSELACDSVCACDCSLSL